MKRGLALCGGGSKGAYEMGVWTAFKELGLQFDLITGTSIGSINAALMVQNDYDTAKKLWETITINDIMVNGINLSTKLDDIMGNIKELTPFLKKYKANNGADIAPLINILSSLINEDKIRNSQIDYGLVTVNLTKKTPCELTKKEIPKGKMLDYIIASSSCFPAFPMHKIDNDTYLDGGYYDNLPIDLAVKMGAEDIIAVDLFNNPVHPEYITSPFVSHYIYPSSDPGSILNFSKDIMAQNEAMGYFDTLKEFGKLRGCIYSFTLDENINEMSTEFTKKILKCEATIRSRGINSFLPTETNPLTKILYSKLRINKPNCTDLFLRGAEICGNICDIPPFEIYNINEYNTTILKRFKNPDDFPNSVFLGNEQLATLNYINGLMAKDKVYLMGCLYHYLLNCKDITAHKDLFIHFPTEFIGALYMATVTNDLTI